MVNMIIDGKHISAEENITIMEAAESGKPRESRDPCQRDEPVCTDLWNPGSMDGGSPWLGCELCDLVWMVSDRKMEEGPRDKEVRYR